MSSRVLKNKDLITPSHSGNGAPDPPENEDDGGNGERDDRKNSEDLVELRKLIVNSEEVGEVLPAAVKRSTKKNERLAKATLPLVEENIRQSVANNPKVLAEALFPAIGPAIRKAIAQALSSMVQSLNQTLEYSVSPKGLGWRLEAFRTGKSFGEIVMLKTLLYRVEQVFLIHKETGLLLQHAVAGDKETQDADMVSAMLTAIEDFVQDSFKTSENATLDSLKVKELSVWIEHSPDAIIAGVIRGTPPLSLRETFSEAIEEIQRFWKGVSSFK
jgi:OOP family OmpA-OmpF porin